MEFIFRLFARIRQAQRERSGEGRIHGSQRLAPCRSAMISGLLQLLPPSPEKERMIRFCFPSPEAGLALVSAMSV